MTLRSRKSVSRSKLRHPTFKRRGNEDMIGPHRKRHLPRAAGVQRSARSKSDHFLEPHKFRYKTKSEFAMPDVAERDR